MANILLFIQPFLYIIQMKLQKVSSDTDDTIESPVRLSFHFALGVSIFISGQFKLI